MNKFNEVFELSDQRNLYFVTSFDFLDSVFFSKVNFLKFISRGKFGVWKPNRRWVIEKDEISNSAIQKTSILILFSIFPVK